MHTEARSRKNSAQSYENKALLQHAEALVALYGKAPCGSLR